MGAFNVYLVDTLNTIGAAARPVVQATLKTYFDDIAKRAGIAEGSNIQFVTADPNAAANELICYYTNHVPHMADKLSAPATNTQSDGRTTWDHSFTVSDVIPSGQSAIALANLTFHEFMHNKQQMGDAMHSQGGLASSSVGDTTQISEDNKSRMAKLLKTNQPQWTGGFGYLTAAANGDPLSDWAKI